MLGWIQRVWGHVVGATLALAMAAVLIPTAWATIDFSQATWSVLPGDTTGGALSIDNSTVGDVLALNLNNPNISSGSITFRSSGITASNADILTGQMAGFFDNAFLAGSSGGFTLSITTTSSSNDGILYANSFSAPTPQANDDTFSQQHLTGNPVITVTFTFTNAHFQTTPSTPWTTLSFGPPI